MDNVIKKEIIRWNNLYPVDKWWRDKHKIAFNSKSHREISFLDQLFEYNEEKLFEEHKLKSEYIPNQGNWLLEQTKTDKERNESIIDEARREMSDLPDTF